MWSRTTKHASNSSNRPGRREAGLLIAQDSACAVKMVAQGAVTS
jgi:hypothetical protein